MRVLATLPDSREESRDAYHGDVPGCAIILLVSVMECQLLADHR